MVKLNFTMSELLHSDEANRHKINNFPTDKVILDNMLNLITYCLQPIREYVNKPMLVSSGYRCKQLNDLPTIKGAKNSQHLTGQACDFIIQGMPVEEVIKKINQSGIEYDQLINERTWVHISFNKGHNRKQCFSI